MEDDIDRELRRMDAERQASLESFVKSVAILSNRLESVLSKVSQIQDDVAVLLERSTPKSSCVFCLFDENVDGHHSGRCHRFPDPVSRAMRASELRLCGRCLRPEHGKGSTVTCSSCRGEHNVILRSSRAAPSFKRRHN
ncbi:unnamed protein product [Nippostrongylus brasiliensis]|uniref:G protein gamma domain-containing protein n=1 Tax=Nippostrongylus brasiliensis TaxID=27835 RepID=A0A0N4Y1Q6_NIPBR|nr:unnamed protein product [Nippostrongylus brasiliensis]